MSLGSIARKVLLGTTVGVAGGGGYGYYWCKKNLGEDQLDRLVTFEKKIIPIAIHYKWLEAKCEKLPKRFPFLFPPVSEEEEAARFAVLHEKYKEPVYNLCELVPSQNHAASCVCLCFESDYSSSRSHGPRRILL